MTHKLILQVSLLAVGLDPNGTILAVQISINTVAPLISFFFKNSQNSLKTLLVFSLNFPLQKLSAILFSFFSFSCIKRKRNSLPLFLIRGRKELLFSLFRFKQNELSFGGFLYKAPSFSFGPAKRRTLFFLFGVSRLVV
jgi:hypothetical protein